MQYYYSAEGLRRFHGADRADTDDAIVRRRSRLFAAVFDAVRARYPHDAHAIAACAWQEQPLAALWHHPRLGWRTRALMVEMGLLLPLPPQVLAALRAPRDPTAEEDDEWA